MTDQDVLQKWHAGEPVITVEMSGFGDDYEHCIQEMGFAMWEAMLKDPPPVSFDTIDEETYREYVKKIEQIPEVDQLISAIGPSGAQFSAAVKMAAAFTHHGYARAITKAGMSRLTRWSKKGRCTN